MDKKLLGKQIKQLRITKGLSQEKLSEMIDISPRQMCVIENGSSIPSLDTFINIAKVLEIDINEFFNIKGLGIADMRLEVIELVKAIDAKKLKLVKEILETIDRN